MSKPTPVVGGTYRVVHGSHTNEFVRVLAIEKRLFQKADEWGGDRCLISRSEVAERESDYDTYRRTVLRVVTLRRVGGNTDPDKLAVIHGDRPYGGLNDPDNGVRPGDPWPSYWIEPRWLTHEYVEWAEAEARAEAARAEGRAKREAEQAAEQAVIDRRRAIVVAGWLTEDRYRSLLREARHVLPLTRTLDADPGEVRARPRSDGYRNDTTLTTGVGDAVTLLALAEIGLAALLDGNHAVVAGQWEREAEKLVAPKADDDEADDESEVA